MSTEATGQPFDVNSLVEELTRIEEPIEQKSKGKINDIPVSEASPLITKTNKPSKGWSITAVAVSVLILGVGICGGVGLLNILNQISLPDGIASFIGHIGFKGVLGITIAGVVVGGIALGFSSCKLHYALKGRPQQPLPKPSLPPRYTEKDDPEYKKSAAEFQEALDRQKANIEAAQARQAIDQQLEAMFGDNFAEVMLDRNAYKTIKDGDTMSHALRGFGDEEKFVVVRNNKENLECTKALTKDEKGQLLEYLASKIAK